MEWVSVLDRNKTTAKLVQASPKICIYFTIHAPQRSHVSCMGFHLKGTVGPVFLRSHRVCTVTVQCTVYSVHCIIFFSFLSKSQESFVPDLKRWIASPRPPDPTASWAGAKARCWRRRLEDSHSAAFSARHNRKFYLSAERKMAFSIFTKFRFHDSFNFLAKKRSRKSSKHSCFRANVQNVTVFAKKIQIFATFFAKPAQKFMSRLYCFL